MPRKDLSEPWLHEASGFWCKKVAGELHYLDRDFTAAKRKLKKLHQDLARGDANRDWLDALFTVLVDEYLDDIKARREGETYVGYRYRLLRALKILKPTLRVGEMRRIHLAKVEQALAPKCSPTTVRDTIACVQGVFEWAVRNDLLETNPLRGYVKPAARGRTRIITPDEFQAFLRASFRNAPFRRVLLSLRKTGCRPKELRSLTWDQVNLDDGLWVIPKHKTVTMQRVPRPRIIPLPPDIWKLCRWLKARAVAGATHVFLNTYGNPYSKDRLVKLMDQMRRDAKIEVKADERIVLYSNRHTFGTEATGKVTDIELAELMGHTDPRTSKRYVHLNASRLRQIQQKVQG